MKGGVHMNDLNSHKDPARVQDYLKPGQRIYFIEIGGISMGGLAELSFHAHMTVGGSDPQQPARLDRLRYLGIHIDREQSAAAIAAFAPDLTVFSSAVPVNNPQRQWSEEQGIPTVERSVFLGALTRAYEQVVNVAGTNGKTTTTAMLALMLMEAKQDPTVHLGAELAQFDQSTVHIGSQDELLVSEACEYRDSFLDFHSTTGIILNIDLDHTDYFAGIEAIISSFARFVAKIPEHGHLIVPADGPHITACLHEAQALRKQETSGPIHIHTFGIRDDVSPTLQGAIPDYKDSSFPDFFATNLVWTKGLPSFDTYYRGEYYARIEMALPGEHNILDALAAMLAAELNGGHADASARVLSRFTGAEGRFSMKGNYRGAQVIADYAHSPSKTKATLEAARAMPHENIWVVYQPLTYSRVKEMWNEYLDALSGPNHIIFIEIYTDREQDTQGMSSRLLVDALNERGTSAEFADDFEAVVDSLYRKVQPGDLILFLGPEEVRSYAPRLVSRSDRHNS